MVTPLLAPPQHLVTALGQRPKTQYTPSKNRYTIEAQGDTFIVRSGTTKEAVQRVPRDPKAKGELSFRRDRRWAVWDERGLTTRDGDWTSTDRLEAISVSPKVASRKEIAETLAKIKTGKRKRAASGVSGARRIGSTVYLLARWDEADGLPWREALVAIDLAKSHPKPRLVGSFGGISLGRGAVDDRLGIENGKLTVAQNQGDEWGIGSYDPKRDRFAFASRGVHLVDVQDDRIVETTAYGTTLAGRQAGGRTIPWLETRGSAEFVPGAGPVLVRAGDRLHNAATGAELRLAPDAAIRRTKAGLLIFWPEREPHSARLVETSRFEERARWERGTRKESGEKG